MNSRIKNNLVDGQRFWAGGLVLLGVALGIIGAGYHAGLGTISEASYLSITIGIILVLVDSQRNGIPTGRDKLNMASKWLLSAALVLLVLAVLYSMFGNQIGADVIANVFFVFLAGGAVFLLVVQLMSYGQKSG